MLRYLKKIGLKAGLTEEHIVTEDRGGKVTNSIKQRWELIGTHTARRSYISNMLKRGYDSHLLMKSLDILLKRRSRDILKFVQKMLHHYT